jgi:CubicO group peptidase (beta-lactamase class C family)
MEINAVDLAKFGWKVLSGDIVSQTVVDDRIFAAVSNPTTCGDSPGGACAFGLGWGRGFDPSWGRTVAHGGSWTGAASQILIYRDEGLVIAILSNRRAHDPEALAQAIGCVVLSTTPGTCPSPP